MPEEQEWWQTFFTGPWLDVQRQARTPEQTSLEAGFLEKALHLAPGARVLDVPCGEGRLALELASRGYRVTGVDITEPLLEDARHKAAGRGLDVTFVRRDMRDISWEGEFDAAYCFWGSFGYFGDKGDLDFLKAVSRALNPGGRFHIDTHVAETIFRFFEPHGWMRLGDVVVLEERRWNLEAGRIDSDWTFIRDSVLGHDSVSIRIYTYRELCLMLEEAGFAGHEGYANLSMEPFKLGSPRLYMVTTRR